jgi:hypothetical protein
MLDPTAITPPTRALRVIAALLVGAAALAPLAELRETPRAVPCAVSSVKHGRATIRTRTHALERRYLTRTLCARDASGRRICAR